MVLIGIAALYRISEPNSVGLLQFSPGGESRVSLVLVTSAILAYLILTMAIYLWARSMDWYGIDWETSHFLWRLRLSEIYGLQPYRDFQYEYGPLLAYLPIWFHRALHPLGASDELSYYVLHWMLDAAGLCSVAFILNRLSMPSLRRNVIFTVMAAAAFLPYMGLNGLLLRFTAPVLGLMLVYRTANSSGTSLVFRIFLATLSVAALNVGLSAETGLSFSVATAIYGVLLLPQRRGIAVLCGVVAAVIISPLLLPRSYYESLFHFSQGANNLPLLPTSPHLVVYLAAMLWFVPIWLANAWKHRENRALIAAISCLTVVLMPGALGRCDPPHVLTYSLTAAMLVLACFANSGKARFRTAIALYATVFVLGFQLINAWVFHVTPPSVVATLKKPQAKPPDFDPLTKYERLALPYGNWSCSKSLQNWLWSHRKAAPEYYLGSMGIYTAAQVVDRLRDLSRFHYALTPEGARNLSKYANSCLGNQWYIRKALVHFSALPCKHQAIDPSLEIARLLDQKYRVVEKCNDYIVWERVN